MRGDFQGGRCDGHGHPVPDPSPFTLAPICAPFPGEADESGVYVAAGSSARRPKRDEPATVDEVIYIWTPIVAPPGTADGSPCVGCGEPVTPAGFPLVVRHPRTAFLMFAVHEVCREDAEAAFGVLDWSDLTATPPDIQQRLQGLPAQLQLQADAQRAWEVEALEDWFGERES